MKKLKIVCSIVIAVAIICLFIASSYPFQYLFTTLHICIQNGDASSIFLCLFHCSCALFVFATFIFLLIVIWKSDLAMLMESIVEKDKAKRKAAKQAKLQREIAEKTAQLEELNNQPSGEENGE